MEIANEDCIYLDNAATTQLDEDVLAEMLPYMISNYGNPSSIHQIGIKAKIAIEKSRKNIAMSLGVKPQTIIFTSGGTESNNLAVLAALRDFGCNHIITSKIEHHSVLNAMDYYKQHYNIDVSYVMLEPDGGINCSDLRKVLELKTMEGKKCLVALMHANNETGNITDITGVASICKMFGALLHSDCVQTIGHYPLNLAELNVDFASASGHKFHGPKGVGFLYIREGLQAKPLIWGGGQERNTRAGTENVAGIVGFAKALNLSEENYPDQEVHINDLKQTLSSHFINRFPGVVINGGKSSLYSVLSVSFPKTEQSESLLLQLDRNGICVAGGSACSGGNSHVMRELGKSENYTTLRISFSRYNTKNDVNQVLNTLATILQKKIL